MDAQPFARVVRVARTGSTSTDLHEAVAAEPAAWPHLSVLVADAQDAGRGRAGRGWVTPPGRALTASILVRPAVPPEALPWLTLLTGLAVQRATAEVLGGRTAVKWPNDVLVLDAGDDIPGWGPDRKVAGVLAEVVPASPPAVVLGVGVNVTQDRSELPVPWATSLALVGASTTPGEVLTVVGRHLVPLLDAWEAAGGDAVAAGLAGDVAAVCSTLGREVVAELPGGAEVSGTAQSLAPDGALVVRTVDDEDVPVRAGDVLLRTR